MLQYLAGNIIVGLSTDTKPTSHVQDNTIFYEYDTFSLFRWNGSTNIWIQEETKAETWTNKTLNAEQNTFINTLVTPFARGYKRVGIMTPAVTSQGSLIGALGGLTTQTLEGFGIAYNDSQEGNVIKYRHSSGNSMGLISTVDQPLITRRAYNPRLKVRAKVSDTTTGRLYIGFASVPELPANDITLDNISGFIVGFSTATPTITVFNNDGTGTMATTSMGPARDTNWHTYEIKMTADHIVALLDNTNEVLTSDRIPALDTDLYVYIQGQVT